MSTAAATVQWPLLRRTILHLLLLTTLIHCARGQENNNDRLRFIEEPESKLTAADGSRIVFKCSAAPAEAEIKWLRNGNIIKRNEFNWIKMSSNKLIVKLEKNSPSSDSQLDELYQCLAELNGQVILSQPAKLIIAELAAFEQQDNVTVSVISGNTAVIPCNLPRGFPFVISEFQYKNLTISRSQDHYRLVPSGALQIFSAKPQDSGIYRCIAHNPFLNETVIPNHFVTLKVIKQKHATGKLVQLKNLHFEVTPKEITKSVLGQNITIECVANGHPVPRVKWIKRQPSGIDGELPMIRAFQENGNLHITTLEKGDEGDYVCRASNPKTGETIESVTNLEISEMPQIVNTKNDEDNYEMFEVDEGRDLELNCETRGFPKPFITWLHNGYVIDSKEFVKGYAISSDEKTLKIVRTNPKIHGGIYQCFATNTLGSTYSTKLVNVRSASEMFSSTRKNDGSSRKDSSRHKETSSGDHYKPRGDHYEIPDPNAEDVIGNSNSLADDEEDDDLMEPQERPNRDRKHRKQKPVASKMTPPSKPIVTRLNDDSVMIRWSVPADQKNNSSLQITFFKVQYRDLSKSIWNTIDEDIPSHIFTYAVSGLESTSTYRFRIAAVYENNDNLNSPNSNKFNFPKDSSKRPVIAPTIVSDSALSSSEILLGWDFNNIGDAAIDGFFIHYQSAASAGQYMKVTAQGAHLREITISHLQPGVMYEFKMQTFNFAGASGFSNIYTAKTHPAPETSTQKTPTVFDPEIINSVDMEIDTPPMQNQGKNFYFPKEIQQWFMQSNQWQLLVVFIVFCALILVLLACCLSFIIRTKSSSERMNKGVPTLPGDYFFNNSNGFDQKATSNHHLAQSTTSLNRSPYKNAPIMASMADMITGRGMMPEMRPLNGHSSMMRLPRQHDMDEQMSTLNRKNSFRKSMSISAHHLAYQHQHQIPQMPQMPQMPKTYDYQQDSAGHSGSHPSNSDSDDGSLTNAHAQHMQQHFMTTMERKRAMQRIQESYIQDNSYTLSKMSKHAVSVTRLNGTLERKRRSRGDLSTIDRSYLRNGGHPQHDYGQNAHQNAGVMQNHTNSMHQHPQYLQNNNSPIVIMQSSC